MIRTLDNGTKVIELGKGTTLIGQVMVDNSTVSSGIYFSNSNNKERKVQEEDVIIEITNMKGVLSYMRALVELLQTWEIEGTEEQTHELQSSIKMLMETLK